MSESLVIVENLTKVFDKKNWAIKKISFSIEKNEGIALIGTKGAGKTVLARLLANLTEKTSGSIEYNFKTSNILKSIGYQFRNSEWPIGFRVKDVVNLYRYSYKINDEEWLGTLTETFDIDTHLNKKLTSCEHSWLRLFTLFLSLIHRPELLILDEISNTIGIDVKNKIINFLIDYKETYKASFLVIAPDKMIFDKLCNRIIVMNNGIILEDQKLQELPADFDFEKFSIDIMDVISRNEIKPRPDPVFRPILNGFKKRFDKYQIKYEEIKQTLTKLDERGLVYISIIKEALSNRNHYIKKFDKLLTEVSRSFLSKRKVEKANRALKQAMKWNKIYLKKIKHHINEGIKKIIVAYNLANKPFFEYLKTKLVPIFKNNNIFVEYDDSMISLSKREMHKLKSLKHKMINEEIRKHRANII